MDEEQLKEYRKRADAKRRPFQFQVRLDKDLADRLKHFMESRGYNQNQALRIIISQFFRGKHRA
jgi:hypothetical protein